jgi:outer membrane protein TolC
MSSARAFRFICQTGALAALLQASAQIASAQTSPPSPLDALVELGLQQNLLRRQQQLAVDRAEAVVREARGLYLPSATLNARYTQVAGNTVNIGSLINPAFGALNQLLERPAFPTNVDIQLPLRQETSIRFAQPVFQPEVIAANRVASAQADAQGAQRDAHARQLAADIRSGYLQFAKARQLVALYDSTIVLLDENARVSQRLVDNGKATPDIVLRARAERSEAVQKRDEAAQLADAARQVVNLRVHRPIDTPLDLFPDSLLGIDSLPSLAEVRQVARGSREEFRQVEHARRAVSAQERLARGSFLPNVSLALDYGVQGKEYRFNRSSDFTALSVVVGWNLFNGGQDAARIQQATLDGRRLDAQRAELEELVALEVTTSWQSALVARGAIATASDRLESARRSFELVRRKHEEGLATPLEFLDARTAYTNAALNRLVTTYDYYLRRVALERAAALYDISRHDAARSR